MAAPPTVDSNGNDADVKARDGVVRSETMGGINCGDNLLHSTVPVPVDGDPMETNGSLGNTEADDIQFPADGHGDSTESSSSFGPSCSISGDEAMSDFNGIEVDSPLLGHINVDDTISVPKIVRQKQVTTKWRETVGPIRWRCQWLELRMKELLSQVAKYDKELDLINHEKDLQLEMIKADNSNPELAEVNVQSHDTNTMRRRKRKRHEDNMDTSLYMKNHQILSYYHENKNSGAETDGVLINDAFDSIVAADTNTLLQAKETDRVFEQYSLREILLRMDGIQSQILRLQDHLSKVRNKHEELSSDVDHTRVKVCQKSQKARIKIASRKKDGTRPQKKDLHSLVQKEDKRKPLAGMPSALSDRSADYAMGYAKRNIAEEGATQPDAKEVTVQMLFSADNPLIRAHIGELYKENVDDVLIDNRAAQEEGYQQLVEVKQAAKNRVDGKDQMEKSPNVHAKNKTEKDMHNLHNEKPVFVAADTRRSQRVRKLKKYDSD